MKKILLCLSLLSVSVSSMANEKVYKCISSNDVNGTQIKEAEISFSEGFSNSIAKANLIVRSEKGVLLETEFRTPLRFVKNTGHVLMDGKKNSRLNPFGDVEYLVFDGLKEKIGFNELTTSMSLSYESLSGPIGNRGGPSFSLECSLEN